MEEYNLVENIVYYTLATGGALVIGLGLRQMYNILKGEAEQERIFLRQIKHEKNLRNLERFSKK